MEPHVFCGPEFILEVPSSSVEEVLQRIAAETEGSSASTSSPTSTTSPPEIEDARAFSTGWTVQPAALLRIQSEIYGACTTDVRRRIHAHLALKVYVESDTRKAMRFVSRRMANYQRIQLPADYTGAGDMSQTGGGVMTSVPPPPMHLAMVAAKSTREVTAEEASSMAQSVRVATATPAGDGKAAPHSPSTTDSPVYLLLYITDSRAAAQVHLLCLRNMFLALPDGCRLLNYFVFGGRAAAIVPAAILRKREQLRARHNFDDELWGLMEAKLTDGFVREVRQTSRTATAGSSSRLLSPFEQHEQDVRAVLLYCEGHVRYAGVFDDDEEASPFLLAMGLCWKLGLTVEDVCRHFARHPRRVIRALALYLARYTLAPEEYVYFFLPSMTDEVVIACTEDAKVTYAMRALSRQLLIKNDVVDAWLPMLGKHWQDAVVGPAITFMEECWTLKGQLGDEVTTSGGGNTPSGTGIGAGLFADSRTVADADVAKLAEGDALRKDGRGIAASYGFRSIAELAEHAAQHMRVLVPQSMATLLKRRRGVEEEVFARGPGTAAGTDADAAIDSLANEEEDDDDFLIHVDVRAEEEEAGEGGGSGSRHDYPAVKRARTGGGVGTTAGDSGAPASGPVNDPHRRIMREGLKLTLSLLGRRTLFRGNDEHYIEF